MLSGKLGAIWRAWLLRFGMTDRCADPEVLPEFYRIVEILERRLEIDALPALIHAVKASNATADLKSSAIVIDANAILRIPGHRKSSDIIDYLAGVHPGPVVLPGQVVQEFWNNQLNAVNTIYKTINTKAVDLSREVAKAADVGVTSTENISVAVDDFKRGNEHLFDPDLIQKTASFLERLQISAMVPHAPRKGLYDIALQRKFSKTPPGFKDDGDGDFLVWVDALWGLSKSRSGGAKFSNVILLTNDKKIDWCRGFTAHPILYAEIKALLSVHFEVWTLDHFAQAIGS